MCLAVPAQIVSIDADGVNAVVALGGVRTPCSLTLIDDAAVGDYVILHVGFALSKLNAEEAERTLALLAEMAAAGRAQALDRAAGGEDGGPGDGPNGGRTD